MVAAQVSDSARMAMLSGSGVAKWPPSHAPACEHSAPNPICKNPIVPDAVPAACGRTLTAPAAEFDITKALPNITSIWVVNSHDGSWLRPLTPHSRLSALPASCSASPNQIRRSSA